MFDEENKHYHCASYFLFKTLIEISSFLQYSFHWKAWYFDHHPILKVALVIVMDNWYY